MVILERNIRVLLQSAAYESGKTMVQAGIETKATDLVIVATTVLLFAIFVIGLASVCYRWSNHQFYSLGSVNQFTVSDVESRTLSARSSREARGIDADIVKSFPTFLYSEVKERRIGKGGAECAVCLCEFEDDETLRLLPNCFHVFHVDCVSLWLSDNSTCPLCRVDLVSQPGAISDLIPDPERRVLDFTDLYGVTWTNRNRSNSSRSMRLSHCRVSEILFSRSHSTGHCMVQPVEDLDRFTLRLPEEVRKKLTEKTVSHVALTQARSLRRGYRSRSAGSERGFFSHQRNDNNNRRLHSMTFSFSDCVHAVQSNSGGVDAVAPLKSLSRSIDYGQRSFERLEPDDRV